MSSHAQGYECPRCESIEHTGPCFAAPRRATCNALRLSSMDEKAPLRKVLGDDYCDDVLRVERLECGHTKTTYLAMDRPAYRRRCWKCAAGEPVDGTPSAARE